jgi:hypothetical protein
MLVDFSEKARDVGVHLGFKGCGQHPVGSFGHDGIETGG